MLFCYNHSAKVSEAKLMNGGGGRYITVCAALFVSVSLAQSGTRLMEDCGIQYLCIMRMYVCMYVCM